MTAVQSCPDCGATLSADAPWGVCPRCVLQLGMIGGQPTVDVPSSEGGMAAPSLTQLGSWFPQLEILGPLGAGGMGLVYKARQIKLDRLVALKVIRPDSAPRAEFAERFEREARAMARLNHPNIAMIHDFGEEAGLYYLVMEFIEGEDLRRRLARGPMTVEAALGVGLQVCDALLYAHERGIIHRDVKPENILIDPTGRVRLVDFGLAKLMLPEADMPNLTATRHVLGTPRYMAPEQLESPREVDHRTDIYATGLVLYEMMTGEVPFGRYELLSERIWTDESLDKIVSSCLAREPKGRYDSVRALRKDLAEFAESEYELVHPTEPLVAPTAVSSASSSGPSIQSTRDRTWIIFLAMLFVLPWFKRFVDGNLGGGWERSAGMLLGIAVFVFAFAWSFARRRESAWVVFLAPWLLASYVTDALGGLPKGLPRLGGVCALFAVALAGLVAGRCMREARSVQNGTAPLGDEPHTYPAEPDDPVSRLVRGPALGLIAVGALNCLGLGGFLYGLVNLEMNDQVPLGPVTLTVAQSKPFLAVCIASATVGAIGLLAGLKLLDRTSYTWAWVASFLGMVPFTLGCLVGLPIGAWALSVLSKPEVLAAERARKERALAERAPKPDSPGAHASAIGGHPVPADER